MAISFDWILDKLNWASKASSLNEVLVRNSIISQRINQEIGLGEKEPLSVIKDTKKLDEAILRINQKTDIDMQLKSDINTILEDLNAMYILSRQGKK